MNSNYKIIKCRVKSDSTFTDLIGYDLLVVRDKAFYRINTIISEQLPINLFKKYCGFLIGREQLDFNVYDHREELAEVFKGFKEGGAYSPIDKIDTSNPPKETWTGSVREFESGAKRDSNDNKIRPDLISPKMLKALGKVLADGAKHYGERNWEKGMPLAVFKESAARHYVSWMNNETDEDHAAKLIFNIMGYIHFRENE